MTRTLLLASLLGLDGCSSYHDDLVTICSAPARAGVTADDPMRMMKMATYISQHLKTSEAKRFMGSLATSSGTDRASLLRAEAASHGVTPCELADMSDAEAKPAH